MKVLISIFVCFWGVSCYGGELEQILGNLSRINNSQFGLSAAPISCEDKPMESLELQCARALCGDPARHGDAVIGPHNYQKFITQEAISAFDSIAPQINAHIDDGKNRAVALANAIEEKAKKGAVKFNISELEDGDVDLLTDKLFRNNYSFIMDQSKPLSERVQLEVAFEDDPTFYSPTYHKALESYLESYRKALKENPMVGIDRGIYTDDERRQVAKDLLKSVKPKFDKYLNENPDDNLNELFGEYFALTEKEIDEASWHDIFSIIFNIDSANTLITQFTTGDISTPSLFCNKSCEESLSDFMAEQDFINDAKKLKAIAPNAYNKELIMSSCRSSVYGEGAKAYEAKNIAQELDGVLNRIVDYSLKLFSEESKNSYRSFVMNEIELGSESDIGQMMGVDEMISSIKLEISSSTSADEYQYKSLSELIVDLYNYKDGPYVFKDTINDLPCDSGDLYTISDSFLDAENNPAAKKSVVNVSMFSEMHLAEGKAIVAHELGHALSYFASKNRLSLKSNKEYMDTRSCISKIHRYETPENFNAYRSGETLYVEEDMADYIAFTAYNDGTSHECSLLIDSNLEYASYYLQLKDPYIEDSHSQGLFRVVREAFIKDIKMPSSCSNLMEQYKDDFRWDKCF